MRKNDYLMELANDLIQIDKETAIELDSWPAAKKFVDILSEQKPKLAEYPLALRLQFLHEGKEALSFNSFGPTLEG